MYVRSKIPLQILQDSCSKSCKTLVWFLHARLCTVHILHGSETCKKSCKGRLARLLQGLVRLWPLLLQYVRFLSKYIRFSCKMCQILMQASLQASCKSLMYGLACMHTHITTQIMPHIHVYRKREGESGDCFLLNAHLVTCGRSDAPAPFATGSNSSGEHERSVLGTSLSASSYSTSASIGIRTRPSAPFKP